MEHTTFETLPKAIDELRNGQIRLAELVGKLIHHQPQQQEEELFINLKQVCDLTGYAPPTIYGLIGKNAIPHFKRGARLFFERAAILSWIREGKRKSKAEIDAAADERIALNNH